MSFTLAGLRALRARPLLGIVGGFLSLGGILILTFFRGLALLENIPTGAALMDMKRLIGRASETVFAETAPVAANVGVVIVICAVLGLAVILGDALAVPLAVPAATGFGLAGFGLVGGHSAAFCRCGCSALDLCRWPSAASPCCRDSVRARG